MLFLTVTFTKSKAIKRKFKHLSITIGIKSITNKANPKINIHKTCQNVISSINNHLLITTQFHNRNKNLYASGNINANHKSSGNFKLVSIRLGNSGFPSNIT